MEAMEALAVSPNKNFRIPRILKNLGSNPLEILNLLRSQKPWERVQHHLPEQPVSKGCPDAGPASRRAAAARPSELAAGSSPAISQSRNDCLPTRSITGTRHSPASPGVPAVQAGPAFAARVPGGLVGGLQANALICDALRVDPSRSRL